ncbi:MAG TPA: hypothetical protein PKG52_06160 [bacterium]|nr:hypothetical protein [bacterium]HPS28629.1 hypothetical protein [bacterium]
MKKMFLALSLLFVLGFVYGQEEPVKSDEPAKEEPAKEEPAKTDEEIKEDAAKAQKELSKETGEPVKEEEPAKAEEPKQIFFDEKNNSVPERNYDADFKPEAKEIIKKWFFLPINMSLGTSIQVGFTIAQLTHKNFEIRLGTLMLGPGFRFGSDVKNDEEKGFVPGLAFLGEVSFGKFFGNPLKDDCFGIVLGVGSKVIFNIKKNDNDWDEGMSFDDTLYADFLPIYLTYRWHKNDKFYDISLRIPLVWQNGVYKFTDETRLYNGVPDLTLNFSFIF